MIDHATPNRWVVKFSPLIAANAQARKKRTAASWRMDETYIKVRGKWTYLYRAVDRDGQTLDFRLSERRQYRCRAKVLQTCRWYQRRPRPYCHRQERSQINLPAKPRRHPQVHRIWADYRYCSTQISQQYYGAGPSFHQADHTANARLQSVPFCGSNVSWDRNCAYDPQEPTSSSRHPGIQAVRRPRSIIVSSGDSSSAAGSFAAESDLELIEGSTT